MTPNICERTPIMAICGAFTARDVQAYVDNGDVPDQFLDIITEDVMRVPVQVTLTKQVYDRQSLAKWREACMARGAAYGVRDPNTNLPLDQPVQLQRVPELEASLRAFRRAVNQALIARGEPPLEEPARVQDSLSRGWWLGCLATCCGTG